MKRKMKNIMFTGSAKVYTAAVLLEKTKSEGKEYVNSTDHQFVLEYSMDDMTEWEEMMENSRFDISKLSEEDLAFQNYLYELCPESYKTYQHMWVRLSEVQKVSRFAIDSNEVVCHFDFNKANTPKGSEVVFIVGNATNDKNLFVTLAKKIIDMSDKKEGEPNEE